MMSKLILICAAIALVVCLIEASSVQKSYSRQAKKSSQGVIRIKLERSQNGGGGKRLASRSSRGSLGKSHKIPIVNSMDTIFYTNVTLGTPGQLFRLTFDTSTTEVSVPSKLCNSLPCAEHDKFDPSVSSTYKDLVRPVKLIEGIGRLGQDTLAFSDIKVTNQTFGQLTSTQDGFFELAENDGYLGLQPAPVFYGNQKPFFHNLIDQKQIDKQMFSLYLNKPRRGNELILGGIDESLYTGEITYAPLTSDSEWIFKMDKIQIHDPKDPTKIIAETCESDCNALATTGTPLIFGPKNQVHKINTALGAYIDATSKAFYILDHCTKEDLAKKPPVELIIGGRVFNITPQEYAYSQVNYTWCVLAIVPDHVDHWYLGDRFLRPHYTVFDLENKRFGLADAV